MQPICIYNRFSNSNQNSKVNFTGKEKALASVDDIVSQKTIKLVKRVDEFIEATWAEIKSKKGKITLTKPEFYIKDHSDNLTLKPLYNTLKPSILFEAQGQKYIDRIIIERQNPNNFRYEKAILTPTGSATIKIYDSRNEKNQEIISKVDELVAKYFPKFLPKITFKESLLY